MNELQVFKNEQLKLEVGVIKNDDGSISVKLDDAARGLGFTQIKNDKEYIKWERVARYLEEYGVSPQMGKDDYIPESIFYLLAMKASNETAKQFQIWIAQEAQLSLGDAAGQEALDRLRAASLDTMSPIEAMNLLYELKRKLEG